MAQDYWQPFKRLKLNPGKPKITNALIIICVLVYIGDQITSYMMTDTFGIGVLSVYGMKINEAIRQGQWWRLFTCIFLHGDVSHIGFNMMAIYIWGKYIEALYGSWRYIVIFLMAGLMGSVASFAFSPVNSLGASGAIYGMFGALLYFRKYDKKLFNFIIGAPALVYMAVSLFSGFTMPYVDNIAHIGGLVGGYLSARIIGLLSEHKIKRKVSPWVGAYLGLVTLCVVIGYVFTT